MPLILPARTLDSGGYKIDNSLRFNDGDLPLLTRTHSDTNHRTFTFSCWVKRSALGTGNMRLFNTDDEASEDHRIRFTSADILHVSDNQGGGATYEFDTNRKFRDISAWYHIVVAWDTTQGTSTNRVKIYVNGVQETSFSTATYPPQNYDTLVNQNTSHEVGGSLYDAGSGPRQPFDGYMSEVYFIDGTAYAPSDFGETNDNGVWIPKDAKGDLTFGTNGFYMEFQQTGTSANSSGMGADTSGNNNHFAATNLTATDQTTDTPTNNFATWNPLAKNPNLPLAEGNTYAENTGTDSFRSALGTIGVSSGKWYWEFRGGPTGDAQKFIVGWTKFDVDYNARIFADSNPTVASDGYGYRSDGNKVNNNSASSYGGSWSSNTIVGVKLDLDNGTIGFIRGSDQGNAYTGLTTGIFYLPFCALAQASNGEDATSYVNFGNGAHSDFGTNTDANGYGGFTYSVPSGYYALNTKNLAKYG